MAEKTITELKNNIDKLQNDNRYLKSRENLLSQEIGKIVNVFETFVKIIAWIVSIVITVLLFIGLGSLYGLDGKHPFAVIVIGGLLFLGVLFVVNLVVWAIANALLVNKIRSRVLGTETDC